MVSRGRVCYRGAPVGRPRTRTIRFAIALTGVALLAGIVVATASALAFEQGDPCSDTKPLFICPGATVGGSYSITFKAGGGCGPTLPYQYKVTNGALPPGLSLASSGVLSGRPTQSGTWNFWVQLSDEDPPSQAWCTPHKADREFQISVQPTVDIDNLTTTTYGTVSQAYSNQLTAMQLTNTNPRTGTPLTTAQWSVVSGSGSPPPGVALSSSGLLSGTPTAEGSYVFKVRAELDPSRFDTETLTVVVRSAVVVKSPPVPSSEVGVPFQLQVSVTGGTGSGYTLALTGTPPPGVTMDADGTISGTPTTAGRYAFAVTATDTESRTATYPVIVTVAAKLDVATQRLRPGKVGKRYRAKLVALGGVQPKLWRVKGRLPRGVKLDRTLGVLSGIPTKAGTYRITVEVTDALKVKSTQALVLVVTAPKT